MKIKYTRDDTKNADTWFAKITKTECQILRTQLEELMSEITEHSVLDDEVWKTATQVDREFFGRGRYFGSWTGNTMISVLGGAIKKLRSGDLTEKQVTWVNRVFEVADAMQQQGLLRTRITPCVLEEIDPQSQTPVERLRNRLFVNE